MYNKVNTSFVPFSCFLQRTGQMILIEPNDIFHEKLVSIIFYKRIGFFQVLIHLRKEANQIK